MDQHASAGPDPGRVHDLGGLARELSLLRARAARGQSRSRISLDELARRVERPRSTVHAYVTGKHLVPSEVLDRIVIALGATPAEQRGWNECWFRLSTGDAGHAGGVADGPALDVPRQLPPDVDGFTGRADELAALDRRRAATPRLGIEVITGTGGVGKTALAVRWAHRNAAAFPDGHLCVDLRGYDPDQPVHPTDALAGFLRALGVDAATISPDMAERAALYRSLLDGRRMLVLLDNVRDSEQARPLLPGTASCLVLVTSRDSLAGLVARHGARRLDLDLLPGDDAVTLLRRLVGGRVRAEPDAAATVVAHCARLPLALRVAAERAAATPAATLGALADELADERHRLDLLDAGDDPRTAVRAVFSWSYRHLPAPAARLFRLLGLHPGREVDTVAAAALADRDTVEVRRLLGLLARVHLLNEVSPGRYSMHDLMRTWAAERAAADEPEDERLAASQRLVEHHLHATATAVDLLYPGDRHRRPDVPRPVTPVVRFDGKAAARTWLDTERATLVAIAGRAAQNGDDGAPAHPTVLLSALLWRHLDVGCHHQEAERLHELALTVAHRAGDRAGQALALNNLGVLHWRLGRHPEAVERLRPALDLYREVGDRLGVFRSLTNLGGVYWQLCRADRAAEYHAQALEVAIASGAGIDQAVALYNLGSQHERAGRYAEAHRCCVRALELYEAAGHRVGEVSVVAALGILATRQGHYAEAETLLRRALATGVELGNRKAEARIHDHLGVLYERMGRHREAAELHQLALAGHDAARDRTGRADALVGLATAYVRLGEHERAERLCQEALDLADEIEHRLGLATASNALGEALRGGGDPVAAAATHLDAERHAAAIGDRYEQGRAFEGLAHSHHDLGDHERAHEYRGRALTVYTDLGVPDAAALVAETTWTTAGAAP